MKHWKTFGLTIIGTVSAYDESVARLHSIDVIGSRPSRKRKLPSLCEAVILESTGSSEAATSQQFKIGLYYPILDAFLMELNQRFSERNVEIVRAIRACSPQCAQFLESAQLQLPVDGYGLD